jgi:hypothetical protein
MMLYREPTDKSTQFYNLLWSRQIYIFNYTCTRLQLNTTGGTESLLDVGVDGELEGSQSTDHEQTGSDTGVGSLETELLSNLDETAGGSLARSTGGLVDLGQHGVGGLGHDGGGETGEQTSAQVGDGLGGGSHVLLGEGSEDGGGGLLVHDELGHGVRNLLEQDRSESGVEGTDTLVLEDLSETAHKTGSELGLGDETDTGSLERTQGDVGEELSKRGGREVDGGLVLLGVLVALFLGQKSATYSGAAKELTSKLMLCVLKSSYPPNLKAPCRKYPAAVGPKPVRRAPAPSPWMTCLKPPIIPLLYLAGSSWIRVLTLKPSR